MLQSTIPDPNKAKRKVVGILIVLSFYDKYTDEETRIKNSDNNTTGHISNEEAK